MRVAMVGPFGLKPKGTMAVRALPLAQALTRRGHQVILFLPPWSYPQDSGREWDEGGVHIENVVVSPRAQIPLRLVGAVRRRAPEAIHFFKPKAYAGVAQWLFWQMRRGSLHKARLVLDEDDWEGAGGWNELEPYTGAQRIFFAWQEQWGLRHADAVTVASRALETIVWSLGVPRTRVTYLPNGVNHLPTADSTRETIRAELCLGSAPTLLLYTRFFEFSLERLADLLTRVLAQVPAARLLLVGKGLFGEEKRFLELAAVNGWRERVVDVGWVEPSRLRGYFAAADVALYPFDDTLINRTKAIVKLMDLLACGVPVVAEAVGQIREYIDHDTTGVLVAPGDNATFAARLIALLNDPPLRLRLGTCAAAKMAGAYDWDVLAARAEQLYAGP